MAGNNKERRKTTARKASGAQGFTLAELVVTVTIMGVLLAVAVPRYSDVTERTQSERNVANMHVIREAFMQYYFKQHMKGDPHFPDPPAGDDRLMTEAWGNTPIPSNPLETPRSLFSQGMIPVNSNGNPFYYDVISTIDPVGVPIPTMILGDSDPDSPTFGVEFSFSL